MALKLSRLDGDAGFHIEGGGSSVASAGDVNGDGIDDLIVGTPNHYSDRPGNSYVVFGSKAGFGARVDLGSLDGTGGFRLNGTAPNDRAGELVASAGDVNGDGLDDVIVGAPNDFFSDRAGNGYVVFGSGAGFDASVDLGSLDGTNGIRLNGAVPNDRAGLSVAGAGDVNGDGIDDVLIGAPGRYSYTSYVVFGSAAGFGANVDLAALDGTDGFRVSYSGYSVAGAGDFNGDGIDDLVVGFGGYSAGVVFGSSTGFPAVVDVLSLDGTNGFKITYGESYVDLESLAGAGDINGDGISDLIVGAPSTGGGYGQYVYYDGHGASYVVFGSSADFAASFDLGDIDGSNGFRLIGGEEGLSGSSVAGAGDVNGDGIDDLLISEPGPYGSVAASYVVFGSVAGFAASIDLDTITGTTGFRIDGSNGPVAGAGDVNYDGFDDVILGGSYVVYGSSELGGANDAPTAADDFLSVLAGDVIDLAGDNGGGSDRDPDLDDLTIGAIGGTPVAIGDSVTLASGLRVTLLGGADVRFDTLSFAAGTVLSDSFEYTVSDGRGTQDAATAMVEYSQDAFPLSALDGSNGFRVDGVNGEGAGSSVAGAGDVNGDGIDDMIIGAPSDPYGYPDPRYSYAGQSYVVFGTSAGFPEGVALDSLDGKDGFRLEGGALDRAGHSVAGAGDINDDGVDDLIVGAPQQSEYGLGFGSGGAYVVYGTSTGFPEDMELNSLDGTNGFALVGLEPEDGGFNDFAGGSVAGAGDVNGDGIDDLIVGAPNTWGADYAGTSYVVFGSSAGFAPRLDLTALDGSDGFRLVGAEDDDSGNSVAGAGDINGDGIDDLIIGSRGVGYDGGQSYVVFGSTRRFAAELDLAALAGSDGFRLDGVAAGGSGTSVAGAGDVNGDGIDDLIIAAPGLYTSAGYVVFGSAAGFAASLDLAALNGDNGFRIDGVAGGGISVASAGDFNGDGTDDLIIGVSGANQGGRVRAGETYVVFGSSEGFAANLDLATLDDRTGLRLGGVGAGDASGSSVAAAGDVNDDGIDDVIVGAPNADPGGGFHAGASYVVFGFRTGQTDTADASIAAGSDNAEESRVGGHVELGSPDLEIGQTAHKLVGLRFTGLDIPDGAAVTDAHIEFEAKASDACPSRITIALEDTTSAATFGPCDGRISARDYLDVTTFWAPEAWIKGETYRTADLAATISALIGADGLDPDEALVFRFTGEGEREAASFDSSGAAPKLVINFETDPPPTVPVGEAADPMPTRLMGLLADHGNASGDRFDFDGANRHRVGALPWDDVGFV